MAGLFDSLGTAARGLGVVQSGLATTGHNIANADTEGYSRQRSVLRTSLPQQTNAGWIGSGVEQVSVERVIDRFVGERLIRETSRQATLDTQASIYRQVESVVTGAEGEGLSDDLTRFFDALDDLSNASDPRQPAARTQVLAAAETLVDSIHRYDGQLRGLQRDADRSITSLVSEVNAITQEIADLNQKIAAAEVTAPANDLRDQRDRLVLSLAEKVDVSLVTDNQGMLSIRISGGLPLVDKDIAAKLEAVVDPANPNPLDPTFSQVWYDGAGSFFDASSLIRGGELGGVLEARDGLLAGAIRDLDAFAYTLADTFNQVHRGGFGLLDANAHDFFTDLSAQTSVDDAARNLGLAADIDPSQGGSIENIAAGAQLDPVAGGPGAAVGDTAWIERLKDLRTAKGTAYLAGDVPGTPTGATSSLVDGIGKWIGDIGQGARSAERSLAQQNAVLSAAQDRRDEISGVSIDEEVAELVKLQAAFQANAKVMSTITKMLDDLFAAI
ncbi:MAG: flagellar hook-associated protein FlgK [Myxococcota bacterium]